MSTSILNKSDHRRSKYSPEIDGLRAIAVLGVLFYHLKMNLPGGYLGVDIFFVISGYLITKNLLLEYQNTGSINLLSFWDRRIRRILPMLLIIILLSWIAGVFILLPQAFIFFAKSALYSESLSANLYFITHNISYTGQGNLEPLLHLWSIGVEEQFYLLYPIFLYLFLKNGQTQIKKIILIACLLSFLSYLYFNNNNVNISFFSPITRAWELGIGALLALYQCNLGA
jgi:peptidoglycan/LPS O-acetylase OafA/YrhL